MNECIVIIYYILDIINNKSNIIFDLAIIFFKPDDEIWIVYCNHLNFFTFFKEKFVIYL